MGPPCTLIVMCSLCCVIYLFDGWYLNTFSADDLQMHTPICYSMTGENVGIYPQECCGYMCCSSAVVGRCVMSKYLWIGASLTPIGKHHHLQLHLISNDGKIIRRCTPSYGDGRVANVIVVMWWVQASGARISNDWWGWLQETSAHYTRCSCC